MAKAKNNYSVTTEFGTFTRSTDRTYAYTVITVGRDEQPIRQRFAAELKRDTEYIVRYQQAIEVAKETGFVSDDGGKWVSVSHNGFDVRVKGTINPRRDLCGFSLADVQDWLSSAIENVRTNEARLNAELAQNADIIQNKRGGNVGWSSRMDLAQKVANDWASRGYYVHIIEVATGKVVA